MKKNFLIEVDINLDEDGQTAFVPDYDNTGRQLVRIRKDIYNFTKADNAVVSALAHELGHMIGYTMSLPHGRMDPRNKNGDKPASAYDLTFNVSQDISERIINSENEAWDLAQLMQARHDCMSGYEYDYRYKIDYQYKIDPYMEVK